MVNDAYNLDLNQLLALEGDNIKLPHFDSSVAWQIGNLAMQKSTKYANAILIDVSLANGQVLFHSPSKPGTVLDNDHWVNRKKKSVFRFGFSSFYMGRKLAEKQKKQTETLAVEDAFFVDNLEYATHGGSLPIRIAGFDGVLATLTISGLAQEEDHLLAIEILEEIKEKLSKQ